MALYGSIWGSTEERLRFVNIGRLITSLFRLMSGLNSLITIRRDSLKLFPAYYLHFQKSADSLQKSWPWLLWLLQKYFNTYKLFQHNFKHITFWNIRLSNKRLCFEKKCSPFRKTSEMRIWNLGTLKLWNFETFELWSSETLKLHNVGTLKLWNLETSELWKF